MPDVVAFNPFSMVYTTLWDMLLSHPVFVRDVKDGNRIRFDILNNRDPLKENVAASDLPEVALTVDTLSMNLNNTSSTSMVLRQYQWLVSTGDYRYTELLARIEWYIFIGMLAWRTKLTGLEWKGQHFCKRANVVSGRSGISNPQQNRQVQGWSAAWQVEIEMHFNTSDLTAELNATT